MGLGRRSIKYVLEHPPKYIDDIKIKKTIRKMFSVKLLVRGERFCVVGGGWGEDGLKVLISKSTA